MSYAVKRRTFSLLFNGMYAAYNHYIVGRVAISNVPFGFVSIRFEHRIIDNDVVYIVKQSAAKQTVGMIERKGEVINFIVNVCLHLPRHLSEIGFVINGYPDFVHFLFERLHVVLLLDDFHRPMRPVSQAHIMSWSRQSLKLIGVKSPLRDFD